MKIPLFILLMYAAQPFLYAMKGTPNQTAASQPDQPDCDTKFNRGCIRQNSAEIRRILLFMHLDGNQLGLLQDMLDRESVWYADPTGKQLSKRLKELSSNPKIKEIHSHVEEIRTDTLFTLIKEQEFTQIRKLIDEDATYLTDTKGRRLSWHLEELKKKFPQEEGPKVSAKKKEFEELTAHLRALREKQAVSINK